MGKKVYKDYSVLMSVYAKENPEYLRESMQSIYAQTVPTNDFVLVCDGPLTPELDKVIDEMQEKFGKRLRVFRQKENRGLGIALNFGVQKCKNELIVRMDSDDVSRKDRCEKQLEIFNKLDVDVVGSNIIEYDEKMKKIFGIRKVPENNDEILIYAKSRNPINHVSVIFRKSEILACGNYLDMPGFEDYYLWVRMILRGKMFYNLQENLVKVRSGKSMVKRRGGIGYLHQVNRFEKQLKNMKFISSRDYCTNMIVRTVFSVVPSFMRGFFYSSILRKKTKEYEKSLKAYDNSYKQNNEVIKESLDV